MCNTKFSDNVKEKKMEITENAIVDGMPESVYHNDPTPLAMDGFAEYTSLSSTVGLAIVEKTEIEARMKINRFNPDLVSKSTKSMDLGSIIHDKVLLGGKTKNLYEVVPFTDFRTKDAKQRRDDLISRDIIPLADNQKTKDMLSNVTTMETRLREQLSEHKEFSGLMEKGEGEQSAFYFDEKLGIWKRARIDWLDQKYPDIIWDYKTTALDIKQWINTELWKQKYIQAPHYMNVFNGIKKTKAKFGFIVQSTNAPFNIEVVVIDETFLEEVVKRYDLAQTKFANCLKTGVWKGTSGYTIHATPPPWILQSWDIDQLTEDNEKRMNEQHQEPEDNSELLQAG